ncbi:hypothetical protein RRG08_039181 [Elysia crispata]|uniref:Uncharacterized protein n=1 Tax=Elysia crispata TaxID=231223 RepID=A0AAE0ZDS2_9GAST|nr:hypothetical protein RRG08_039181 [Elysia crispata]
MRLSFEHVGVFAVSHGIQSAPIHLTTSKQRSQALDELGVRSDRNDPHLEIKLLAQVSSLPAAAVKRIVEPHLVLSPLATLAGTLACLDHPALASFLIASDQFRAKFFMRFYEITDYFKWIW